MLSTHAFKACNVHGVVRVGAPGVLACLWAMPP